eukprot:4625261-Alexandrium_andersonii.AAC.1
MAGLWSRALLIGLLLKEGAVCARAGARPTERRTRAHAAWPPQCAKSTSLHVQQDNAAQCNGPMGRRRDTGPC